MSEGGSQGHQGVTQTFFEIHTPKDEISGADVARVFYEENDLERIARYCEKDVAALIQLFLRMKGEELVADANISIVE